MRLGLVFSLCLTSLTTLWRRAVSGMYKSAHELCWWKHVQNKLSGPALPFLGEVCPASWDPLWACTRETRGCEPLSHGLGATVWKMDSNCSSTNMGVTGGLSQSSLIWTVWLGFSVSLWQQILLKWSLPLQGEKWKGDLAAGGKPAGFSPRVGQGACCLVVKIQLDARLARLPPSPSWTWLWRTMLLTSGLQGSLFPPPSPTPSRSGPQIPACVLGKGMWGCPRSSLQRWLDAVLTALLTLVLSPPAPQLHFWPRHKSPFPPYPCLKHRNTSSCPLNTSSSSVGPHKLHVMCCSRQGEGTWWKESPDSTFA